MAIEVLLIEDDSALAELLGSALSEAGFAVRTAPDGAEGLRIFTERPSEVGAVQARRRPTSCPSCPS